MPFLLPALYNNLGNKRQQESGRQEYEMFIEFT